MTSRRRADRARPGRHHGGSFERATDAIRIGEEATRKLAASLSRYSLPPEQYAALRATQVRGKVALGTVDEIRFEGLRSHQSRGAARAGADQARRGALRGEDRRGPAPHLRPPRLRRRRLSRRRRGRRASRDGDHAAREGVGTGLPALRPGSRKRLPGRQRVQPAGPVQEDVAQPAGRRVADRGPGRSGHAPVQRVLPAAERRGRCGSGRFTAPSGRRHEASSRATTRSRTT